MPTKGERTRHQIVSAAAKAFNTRGYAGTSISDILTATGLEKGGLYRHFASKDELALASFDYAVSLLRERHEKAERLGSSPLQRLLATIESVARSIRDPAVVGGCPILNTAIEADDTNDELRKRAAAAMSDWQTRLTRTTQAAIAAGELQRSTDARALARIVTAALEGAIMTTALLRDWSQMDAVAAHLRDYVLSLRAQPRKARR